MNSIKSAIIFSLLCIFSVQSYSQENLVPNPSFEEFDKLPDGDGKMIGYVKYWENPAGKDGYPHGTPDYLHAKGTNHGRIKDEYFARVEPKTGKAIVGIITYNSYGGQDFREYFSVHLMEPLTPGKNYKVSFWMTNGKKPLYCDKITNGIGISFTIDKPRQKQFEPLTVTPAWTVSEPFKNTNWVEVKFDYKPTEAVEYMTVGNFRDDVNTTKTRVYDNGGDCAYYFFDDFSVLQLDKTDEVAKTIKPKVKIDRDVKNVNDFYVDKDSFQVEVWDHREEDGDTISMIINGKAVVEKHALTNRKKSFWVRLEENGDNMLILYAHNLGIIPPNTAAIRPLVGDKRELVLSSNLKKSQSVRFIKVDKKDMPKR